MIRVLLGRSLRQHLTLLGVLSVGLFLFQVAVVWVAAELGIGPGFRALLESFLPRNVVEIIFTQFGFGSFAGTISFGYQHPMVLISGIAMVLVMATVPAQERESGFLELILARPVPRSRYLAATTLSVFLTALLTTLAVFAGSTAGLWLVRPPEAAWWTDYLPAAAGLFLLLMAIGGYTLLLATDAKRRGTATAQAVGITLLFYWLDFMGDYWDLLDKARMVSPFRYFDPALATRSGLTLTEVGVLAGIAAATIPGAFLNFRRQDL